MAQLSRPYQIGLVAVALLAAAWLLLFQGHHSSPSTSGSSQAPAATARTVQAPTAPAPAKAQGTAGQATGHGSASSLGAYGKAIEKARGAVATSKQNAKELESKSASASSAASAPSANTSKSSSSSSAAAPAGSASHARTSAPGAASSAGTASHAGTKSAPVAGQVRSKVALRQHAVEAQLAQGKVALIFFWNPRGSDDRAVNRALGRLPHGLRIAVDRAPANAVATFGTITRGVQVYGTPTLLVVNKKGEVTTLTGLQDSYTSAQAIREAWH